MIHRFVCAFKHDSPVLAEWSSGAEATNEKRRNAKGERRRNAGEGRAGGREREERERGEGAMEERERRFHDEKRKALRVVQRNLVRTSEK